MTDSILYNQEVTAEILNDIAIDLGNTSFSGFGEEKFGADALNDITKSLVTKGILQSESRCQPIKSDGYINIQPGVIVFENGAKKKITEVISVPCEAGTYIYAQNDKLAGRCEIKVSTTYPTGDFIMLAQIKEDGTILDTREFSSAKVEIPLVSTKVGYQAEARIESEDWVLVGQVECPGCVFWVATDDNGRTFANYFGEDIIYSNYRVALKVEKVGDIAHIYGYTRNGESRTMSTYIRFA